jgi:glutamate-5-semialdehyde dehydrogenase
MTRPDTHRLEALTPGMPIVYGGDKVALVDAALAARFVAGDRLLVVDGALLHVPAAVQAVASEAVGRAHAAFGAMAQVSDTAITGFFEAFARRLEDEATWAPIALANAADVRDAQARGRSTTRLAATARMRADMIAGLREWRDTPGGRERLVERVEHGGWSVEQVTAPLGVVGFVFEGRPNVFADAAGVIRTGNTVVFRIGSDALGTARAIAQHALAPALAEAGLPEGAAVLVDSAERSAGWALFSDARLSLAVARGSGPAVDQLGGVARQSGVPVSLHGTGGAWLVADTAADAERFAAVVRSSLDRKVCNTLNVCCIVRSRAAELVPLFLEALAQAGDVRGHGCKLHVVDGDFDWLPEDWRSGRVMVRRADGDHDEPLAQVLRLEGLATEWEWEETPEVSLKIVDDLGQAIALFNRFSPQFIGSLVSDDPAAHARFWAEVNAGFVGDGFTRWVDGQYALNRPELGLSNWQHGRLFARGGVLSGDGVYTVRARMRQNDLAVKR